MKAYKGFNKDMTCNPDGKVFQFEEGKTYEEPEAKLCESGFHACEAPLDVLRYYEPGRSVYHEVELDDVSSERKEDSKLCARKIKIGARISIRNLVEAQIEYVKSRTTTEHTDPKQATAGYRGAATAGDSGAATAGSYGAATAGYRGAATAGSYGAATAGDSGAATAGDSGAATSRGSTAVGKNGVGLARGNGVKVKGGLGAILLIAEENEYNYDVKEWRAFMVDGDAIKEDTWYKLENGELVEVKE